jgi:hypothetical protein
MAISLVKINGTMKVSGLYEDPVFLNSAQGIFSKTDGAYKLYCSVFRKEYPIGDYANVLNGATPFPDDDELETFLGEFFGAG